VLPDFVAASKKTSDDEQAPDDEPIPPGGGMHEHLVKLAVRLVYAGIRSQQTIAVVLLAEFEARRTAPASEYNGDERATRRIAKWAVADSEAAKAASASSRVLVLGDAGLKERP
jgi:hypothetical protein